MEKKQISQDFPKTDCGGQIKDPSKYPSAEYRGEKIYFCTQACLEVFLLDPDPFMAGRSNTLPELHSNLCRIVYNNGVLSEGIVMGRLPVAGGGRWLVRIQDDI